MDAEKGMKEKGKGCSSTSAAPPRFDLLGDVENAQVSARDQLQKVINLLSTKRNILVLVGAGISTACGIKDFRSSNGLYSTIESELEDLGLTCAEDLFDLEFFTHNPLYYPLGGKKRAQPSDTHKFLAQLDKNNRLLRVYSQNIDGLEEIAGVPKKKIVYAHGSLGSASCLRCKKKFSSENILPAVEKGELPLCQAKKPTKNAPPRLPSATRECPKRSTKKYSKIKNADDRRCNGVLKPGVTFFGEGLDQNVQRALEADRSRADLLLVLGTSLSVAPISKVIEYLSPEIPRILINNTVVHRPKAQAADSENGNTDFDFRTDYTFDAYLLGSCDAVTSTMAKQLFTTDRIESSCAGQKRKREDADRSPDVSFLPGESQDSITKRALLFPGGVVPDNSYYQRSVEYQEIAHCDGCKNKISGVIQKCNVCFDYDLCSNCFPHLSKSHFDGTHKFVTEAFPGPK